MKILFHVGVGNTDRPKRWSGVNYILSKLAKSLEDLGHECLIWCHKKAKHKESHTNIVYSNNVKDKIKYAIKFNPDWIFTWNGSSEGDREIVRHFGINKMIFGELGFFDHYKTVYFDFSGTNSNSEVLYENLINYNEKILNNLIQKYKKPRLFKEDYLFVPLQDENDTQITHYSPIKKMDQLLSSISKKYTNIKILYKKHPQYDVFIKNRENFIEVYDDVHHYIPYAKKVIGINSTVLFETLLYHNNIECFGYGLASRKINSDIERKKYITHCYNKQFYFEDLENPKLVENSDFYKKMCNKNN
tara:strand:- start:1792 stop:2700 length:909 start_codon:yes stop_codon:yes gene_type:complete